VSPSRAAPELGAWPRVRRHEKARCVVSPPSQSPIGVVKRSHALNLASRIKNAYLARTKSERGFPHSRLLDPSEETRVQRRVIQRRTNPTCEALLQLLSPPRSAETANSCVILSSSRNADSFSSDRTTNLLPLSRCASTIQIVRPSKSTAETQTPTGFAQIVSDSFPGPFHGCFSSQSF
jgi:hypothetical protein